MAYSLPQSQFVGVDLSQGQVEKGLEMTGFLKLKNVSLICQNLMEIDESLGQFDYIIAHEVFSWVPPETQRRIFDICMHALSPQGIAYISYNVLPGWNLSHDSLKMSEQSRYLVWCLNGSRDCAEILTLLDPSIKEGKIHFINPKNDDDVDHFRDELAQ